MAKKRKAHPEEDVLERYAMNRLGEPALGALEEHLLLCESCQERLDEVTEYVGVVREATANAAVAVPAEAAWRRWLRLDWLPMPVPAMAGVALVVAAMFLWQPWQTTKPAEWRTVELATLRGEAAGQKGVAGFALHLRLDVAGVEAGGATAQVVTATGSSVTELPVTLAGGKAELRYAAGLKAGQYWVRLKQGGETIREYSLVVEAR